MMNGMPMHGMMWGFGGPWLALLLWVIIIVPPFWKIFSKTGYSGWLSLLMLVPLVNLIVLYVIAFSDWPALRYGQQPESSRSNEIL